MQVFRKKLSECVIFVVFLVLYTVVIFLLTGREMVRYALSLVPISDVDADTTHTTAVIILPLVIVVAMTKGDSRRDYNVDGMA